MIVHSASLPTPRLESLVNDQFGAGMVPLGAPVLRLSAGKHQYAPKLTFPLVTRHRRQLSRGGVAICVVEGNVRDLATAPDDESTDGSKDESNDEQGRQDSLWCQDGLPRLETLLLERGVCC